ncbi:hypothetical protein ACI3KY_07320 [Microbacterium sp. ZW T2_14]|uniref:hypothetical protein n=1 Tax=Microbacterium sp. ZW T2_14 TaxID=3378079 RepID=UPI003853C80C
MTRIDRLSFPYPAALYRGDGSGAAIVHRQAAIDTGPSWARVIEPGAGIGPGFVYLQYHGGDVAVFAVDGAASDEPPAQTHLDPRLRAVGEYFESADPDEARRSDIASGAKRRADLAAIRAATFAVAGDADGRRWSVEVGPTVGNSTQLVLRSDAGEVRLMDTTAPRERLEQARTTTVAIQATEMVNRRFGFGTGRRPNTVQLTLRPAEQPAEGAE